MKAYPGIFFCNGGYILFETMMEIQGKQRYNRLLLSKIIIFVPANF